MNQTKGIFLKRLGRNHRNLFRGERRGVRGCSPVVASLSGGERELPSLSPMHKNAMMDTPGFLPGMKNNITLHGYSSHQYHLMPRSTEDGLGRRRFQIQKEKAVEEAYEKIRRSFGQDWQCFSPEDWALLRDLLGEIWINVDRDCWSNYCFSTLSHAEVLSLIAIAKEGQCLKCMTKDALARLDEILE